MYARENEIGMKARDLAVPSTPTTEGSPEICSRKTDLLEREGKRATMLTMSHKVIDKVEWGCIECK